MAIVEVLSQAKTAPQYAAMSTKKTLIAYWVATGLLAFAFAFGGAMDLARTPEMLATMDHLGYPPYFAVILGAWKVLGAAAVVAPGMPRLKEWAYAGMAFDLTGAMASHLFTGDGVSALVAPVVLLAALAVSWAFRPRSRVLAPAQS